jgi:2-methylisocitrate lyase-like PEP mutase family enzyme
MSRQVLRLTTRHFLNTKASTMAQRTTNEAAKAFKALHVPGQPIVLPNVYDTTSARIVSSLPQCKALATASFAVAAANGTDDTTLDLKTYLPVIRDISIIAQQAGKPLTVDLQDGYGDQLEEAVRAVIDLGVVGINLEDSDQATLAMMDESVAVDRVRRALAAATEAGVPDFVINARSDAYFRGGSLDDAIHRGKLLLDAGATTVYILIANPSGFSRQDVELMVKSLGGMVNISVRLPSGTSSVIPLTTQDLTQLGVARISVGPQLYFAVVQTIKATASTILGL